MTDPVAKNLGFTLIELMVVLALLTIVTSVAAVIHYYALARAQSVEAEVVLVEINRLETVYYANHGTYAGNLSALGFSSSPALKYYKIDIQLQQGGAAFQATALPFATSANQLALVLIRSKDGVTTFQKVNPGALARLGGGQSGDGGTVLRDQESGGALSGAGGKPSKANCREGGEATVADDGLLDMNFCLR